MQQKVITNLSKYNTDTVKSYNLENTSSLLLVFNYKTSDLTNLRVSLDQRFSKLEKDIEKINSLTIKESNKGISCNKVKCNNGDLEMEENNFTLSLNFDRDPTKNPANLNQLNEVSQWNKVFSHT